MPQHMVICVNCGKQFDANKGGAYDPAAKRYTCKACAKGIGTATLFISFPCHRNCYFCFNPNQDNYEYYRKHKNDWKKRLPSRPLPKKKQPQNAKRQPA